MNTPSKPRSFTLSGEPRDLAATSSTRVDLDDWIDRIRSDDAMTFEDAFFGERPAGDAVVPRLVAELQRSIDVYTRGKFSELLGEMGDARALPVLLGELSHPEQDARRWAVLALENLGIEEGVAAAAEYRRTHGSEFVEDPAG